MGRRWLATAIIAVVSSVVAPAALGATVGDPDPAFNNGDVLHLAAPPPGASPTVDDQEFNTVVVDNTNRITLGGTISQQATSASTETQLALLARVTPGGAVDSTFGSSGIKIAAAYDGGQTMTAETFGLDSQFRLTGAFLTNQAQLGARLADNGGLQATGYGTSGGFTAAPAHGGDLYDTSAVGPDGSVYFVDDVTSAHPGTALQIDKIDASGNTVAGYGGQFTLASSDVRPGGGPVVAAVDSQNRLVVARTTVVGSRREAAIMRFTAAGALDTSWGAGPSHEVDVAAPGGTDNVVVNDVAIAPGDQVVISGTRLTPDPNSFLDELTTTGAQTAFGYVDTPINDGMSVAVQSDGKVLLAGFGVDTGDWFTSIVRYTTAGALDPTFGHIAGFPGQVSDSQAWADGNQTLFTRAMAISPDGHKLIIAGMDRGFPNFSIVKPFVLRYLLQDPTLAPELTKAPNVTGTPTPGSTLTCNPGTWTNSPTITVFWDRAPRSTTSNADPAWLPAPTMGTHYSVTAADVGLRIRCREHAHNANGDADGPSNSLRVDTGAPALLTAPTISGLPITFHQMHCDPGTWTNGPDLSVQWLDDGTPIANATAPDYTLQGSDRHAHISCQVTAANDVGTAPAPVRSTNDALVVAGVPQEIVAPTISQTTIGARATDIRLTCGNGVWDDDYGQYDYQWERAGAIIAGAVGQTYDATVADLGQDINCEAFSTNPAGRSRAADSETSLVPLPSTGQPGAIYTAGGFNHLDPTNMMAVTQGWLDAVKGLVVARRQAAVDAARTACQTSSPGAALPSFATLTANVQGVYMSAAQTCGVLLHAPAAQIAYPPGNSTYWTGDGSCELKGVGTGNPCPILRITVPVLNAATPPDSLSTLETSTLDAIKPVEVLWDFNNDGKTDAMCDPDAPIVRTLFSPGVYHVRAVIVSADSAQTGLYSVTNLTYSYFPTGPTQPGQLRDAQPFACKTSLEPPPDATQPCVNEATIGRTHVVGNICPISARAVPEADLDGLPADVQKVLADQSVNGALRAAPAPPLPTDLRTASFKAAPLSTAYVATTQISALSTLGNDQHALSVASAWASSLKKLPFFNLANAQYAMDQVYVIKGAAKVNGIDFSPVGDALTVMVPSDVKQAIDTVKQMTISNRDVATTLGGIPIGDPGALSADLTDQVNAAIAPTLRDVNLDALKQSLLSKLDLGPFNLAGDAKLRMADDGTAFIDAQAELKGAFSTGSGPIRAGVTVHADRNGNVSLAGIHLEVPKALLGAVTVSGLKIDYDSGGLSIQGSLLFPPINDGIAINKFRVDSHGNFQELDVSYLAGAGQGIDIGPGMFLVKLGGGLSLNPDEIRARAAVSLGPSPGGGCPTAGIDADMNVHFGPPPFFVDANSTVELVCIPIGNVHFHADSTGLVQINAKASLDVGPIYATADVNGELRLPNWQVDAKGDGGIRGITSGTVKALLSNLGMAGCLRVKIFPATPISDAVYISGGAGVRFINDLPPLTFPQLVAGLDLFTGCDLTSYSPFGRDARAAAADGSQTFTLPKNAPKVVALEVLGAGGAPHVQVITPAGKTLDASAFGTDFKATADISGVVDPTHSRTLLFVHGAPGLWKVEPVAGSPAVTNVMQATILPAPKVTAHVGGTGASRTLRYRVAKLKGEVVRFVENSKGGQRAIKTVRGGGSGTAHFVTSEGHGTKRTVVAEVSQSGIPRANIVVAHFTAPSPRAARARVHLSRHGASVTVTWNAALYAQTYRVSVQTGRGRSFLLTPKGRARRVSFGGLMSGEGAVVRVVGVTAGGRPGPAAIARLGGALKTTTVTKRNRWQVAKAKPKKTKKPHPKQ
jgi:uncharacterized delta-60 repeat protein